MLARGSLCFQGKVDYLVEKLHIRYFVVNHSLKQRDAEVILLLQGVVRRFWPQLENNNLFYILLILCTKVSLNLDTRMVLRVSIRNQ